MGSRRFRTGQNARSRLYEFGVFCPEPVLRTRTFNLRADWPDRTDEKRPKTLVQEL